MKKLGILIVGCLLILAFSNTTKAAPLNPSFEEGDLTGWISSVPPGGSANVVSTHLGSSTTYDPVDGSYFAELKTDGPDDYTTISQLLSISAGEILSGWAAFDARDSLFLDIGNDNAWVKIYDNTSEVANPWYSDVAKVGSFGDGAWKSWSWTASTAGTYTLVFGIANQWDPSLDSYALFDHVTGGTPVPEPGTITFLVVGMLGLIGLKRKSFIQAKT